MAINLQQPRVLIIIDALELRIIREHRLPIHLECHRLPRIECRALVMRCLRYSRSERRQRLEILTLAREVDDLPNSAQLQERSQLQFTGPASTPLNEEGAADPLEPPSSIELR
jgi:hypothetical protein